MSTARRLAPSVVEVQAGSALMSTPAPLESFTAMVTTGVWPGCVPVAPTIE